MALASVVCASLFLGMRRPNSYSRDPDLDRAWASYNEAVRHARGAFDETDGNPVHPTAALAEYLEKREDASRRSKPTRLD